MTLEAINNYCEFLGNDPLLVQGAGGNISFKQDNFIYVKASGMWLADANEKNIFVKLDFSFLRQKLNNKEYGIPVFKDKNILKPSIETMFHAILPHKIVLHLHPIIPLLYLVKKKSKNLLAKQIKNKFEYTFIEYKKPGEDLAIAISDHKYNKDLNSIIFLENHGIIIAAENLNEIHECLLKILEMLPQQVNYEYSKEHSNIKELVVLKGSPYKLIHSEKVQQLTSDNLIFHLKNNWALYPDHVVFLGEKPHIIHNKKELDLFLKSNFQSKLIFIKNKGVYYKNELRQTIKVQLNCYFDIVSRQPKNKLLKSLNFSEIQDLVNWESEKYRIKNAK